MAGPARISLPQGGGAIRGVGDSFAADPHTGSGSFAVPLAVPPGRDGVEPAIGLTYCNGNGNGPFGLGWTGPSTSIRRRTSTGVPRFDDDVDNFELASGEELVAVHREGDAVHYQPRTEGMFARIIHRRNANNDTWEVHSRDGTTSTYGTPEAAGADGSVIADPAHRASVFAWMLTETVDPFGNRISYSYERDAEEDGLHVFDQLYVREIRYLDVIDQGERRHLVCVRFNYDAAERPDCYSDNRAGFEIRTRRRCQSIDVETHADAPRLVRQYLLRYVDERVTAGELAAELLPPNGVSLLSEIQVVGHDGGDTETMPPLEFGYTTFDTGRRDFRPLSGQLPGRSLANPQLTLVDIFGDGLPDVLEMSAATVRYWRNLGNCRFDPPREMTDAPAGLQLGTPGVQLIDADGDGRPDVLVNIAELAGYFPLRHSGTWDRKSFQRYRRAPSFALNDPEVHLVDLDGDGVTDAVRSGSSFECFFNDRNAGWSTATPAKRRALAEFPNVSFADARVHWADMCGDGLEDIVYMHRGSLAYWPNRGRGKWGKRLQMAKAPDFPGTYEPRRVLLGDLDGDGLADLIYVDHRRVLLWINQGGNGWSSVIEITGTPEIAAGDDVQLVDLMGTGTVGVLWTRDSRGAASDYGYFLDLTGGRKPYLLDAVDNHMGAVTRIEHQPSTTFFLADQSNRATRWRTTLPFPAPVVSRIEVVDAISGGKLTTEYRYRHGYYDGGDREFRGFGMVEQTDTQTFTDYHAQSDLMFDPVPAESFAPPTRTRTWFHQGPVGDEFGDWQELDFSDEYWSGDPQLLGHTEAVNAFLRSYPQGPRSRRIKRDALRALRGSVLRSETYMLDSTARQDRPLEVTEAAYGLREESPPLPGVPRRRIFFPHQITQRVTVWERGDDPLTNFSFTSDHDEFGQPRRLTEVAPPRRSTCRRPVTAAIVGAVYTDTTELLAISHRTQYAEPDDGVHIRDCVAQKWTYELANPVSVTESAPSDVHAVLRDQAAAARDVASSFAADLAGTVRLVDHSTYFYDGPAYDGLPLGRAGKFGALTRVTSLVMTDVELDATLGAKRPSYLDGAAPVPAGSPPGFGSDLGFRRIVGDDGIRRYYVDEERSRFDFQTPGATRLGLVLGTRDARGADTTVGYDQLEVVPVRVVSPVGLETLAAYDYRVLQVNRMTDENGNVTEFGYSPLGAVTWTAVRGDPNLVEGDRAAPSTVVTADYFAYEREGTPICVRTVHRVYHDTDTSVPVAERDATIESRDYCDGFGRVVQTRTQAEDMVFGADGDDVGLGSTAGTATSAAIGAAAATRVIVSGWTIFDNKGQPVRNYEPFFTTDWQYQAGAVHGVPTTIRYDGSGRVIRTVRADGAESRTVFGIPGDLSVPDEFVPTPWEAYGYDANDLAGISFGPTGASLAAEAPASHYATPCSGLIDAGGRVISRVVRNGPNPLSDWHLTRARYDTADNLLSLTDPLGRQVLRARYDLVGNALLVESADAGARTTVRNANGEPVEYVDGEGRLELRTYDAAGRLQHCWARDTADASVTLREWTVYGDEGDFDDNRAVNRLGEPAHHYDEAGLTDFERYDFASTPITVTRRVVKDAKIDGSWTADWSIADPESNLDDYRYTTDLRVDALDRVIETTYPEDHLGRRAHAVRKYNRAGLLERVELDGDVFIDRIAYNARGQRVLIVYGNGVLTRYEYDELTWELRRLHSQGSTRALPAMYTPTGMVLQDIGYRYDLVGNITATTDRSPGCGVPGTPLGADALDRAFNYDALYQLTAATGRECGVTPANPIGVAQPRCTDTTLARPYEEVFEYDHAGNVVGMKHTQLAADGTRRTRKSSYTTGGAANHLQTMTVGGTASGYQYDACGQLVGETSSRGFAWDHAGRMSAFTVRAGAGPASVVARYLYDSEGDRTKKVVRKAGGVESTVYLGGMFEHRRIGGFEQCVVHVLDDDKRIAAVRVGAAFPDDGAADMPVQYHLGDQLDSSHLVVGGASAADRDVIRWEEYTPYGETSFGSFARKRYRFTAKECDEESGLYYVGARYYAPWLARWTSCDPAGLQSDTNLYVFCANNPVTLRDLDGEKPQKLRVKALTPGVRSKEGKLIKEGSLKLVSVTVDPTAKRIDSGGGGGARGSPKGDGAPGDGESPKAGVKDGIPGGTSPKGTGKDQGNSTPGGPGGGTGGSLSGASATGSPHGSPTGSATSNGGSPNGTDDPGLHKKSSGEGGTGITGKGTGSLTQTDLAVLIVSKVADPVGAVLDGIDAKPEGGTSGGLPEGNSKTARGNPLGQAVYLGAVAIGAALSGALNSAKATLKNGTKAIQKGTGDAYSVLFRFKLKRKSWPKGIKDKQIRKGHDKLAWARMERWLERIRQTNPALAQHIEQQVASGKWTWHHAEKAGVLELVPHSQHNAGGPIRRLFHYLKKSNGQTGAGGFKIWGRNY